MTISILDLDLTEIAEINLAGAILWVDKTAKITQKEISEIIESVKYHSNGKEGNFYWNVKK